jgi:hypothetical protein
MNYILVQHHWSIRDIEALPIWEYELYWEMFDQEMKEKERITLYGG